MSLSVFLLELGLVVVGLAALARIAGRIGFSPIPLYLLAGLAFGKGGIVPVVTAESFIEIGAEIGVILLLFMLGLEYSANELASNLKQSMPAGAMDLLLNFAPGFAAGIILGFEPATAVLLGGVTYVSSTGVIARLLDELGWVGNRETPVILSILVIEDLLMALYLPLVAILLQGEPLGRSAVTMLVAIMAVAIVLLVALRWGEHLSRIVFSHSDEVLLLSIFGLILVVSGLAQSAHISAAVGAFLVGIALSGPAAERAHGLLTPLRDLFAAVFFVFFGLRTDPGSVAKNIGAAVLLALITALTKLATGWWASRRAGIGTRGRFRSGAVLIARGEFSIAIAGVGLAAGLGERFASLVAAYVLVLAVGGIVVARFIDPFVASMLKRRVPETGPVS